MAARVDPRHVRARHQSMHHFIANAALGRRCRPARRPRRRCWLPWTTRSGGGVGHRRHRVPEEWASLRRRRSPVLRRARQTGELPSGGERVGAHERASFPVAYRLYLPEAWAQDRRRRRAAGVPNTVAFPPEMANRARADHAAQGRGCPGRARHRGCRLRRRDRVSRCCSRLRAFRTSWGSAPRRRYGHPAAATAPAGGTEVAVGHRRWFAVRARIAPSACTPWLRHCPRPALAHGDLAKARWAPCARASRRSGCGPPHRDEG